MKFKILTLLILLPSFFMSAQDLDFEEKEINLNEHIDGTLLLPVEVDQPRLVILIAGSGPTDRNGNQNFMKTDNLKKLAYALGKAGIASFRYDKRIVKQIRNRNIDKNIMFDDFVADAISVVEYFRPSEAFSSLFVLGHSQGSLVGMLAAKEGADGFISIAGAGKPIDEVITEQVERTAPMFVDDTKRVFSVLKENKTTSDFPEALQSIFSLDIQPFMSNWMSYNPAEVIANLEIPTLIVNGTKDLQVKVEEAELLHNASANSKLAIIESMNHVLVPIEGDDLENSKSYNEPYRKLSSELLRVVIRFIKSTD